MRLIWAPLALCLLAATACAPPNGEAGAASSESAAVVHPISGLPIIPVTVTTSGGKHRFAAEYAADNAVRIRGLMFRTGLGPDEGMFFDFSRDLKSPIRLRFWMKNTVIPLDIIFIRKDGVIDSIAANMTPYSEERVFSDGPALYVLEIAGGRAEELGIVPGDKVRFAAPRP